MGYSKRQVESKIYRNNKDSSGSAIGNTPFVMYSKEYNSHALKMLSNHSFLLIGILLDKLQCKRVKGKYVTNNGDLSITHRELKENYDISMSPNKFYHSIEELIIKGFVIKTRQGGKNMCSLYAVTFMKIGDIRDGNGKRKIDHPPTEYPTNEWRDIAIREGKYRPASNDDQF